MKLKDRAALVIGGASGIGYACAEACADEGAKVMIADINEHGRKKPSLTLRPAADQRPLSSPT